jgi:serine/threonine-protein kinase Stk1
LIFPAAITKVLFNLKSPIHGAAGSLTIAGMPSSGNAGAKMSRDWRQWEGQVVNGTFPLRQYLGGSDHSAVFLTERRGRDPQRAAIKLIAVDPANAALRLARWEFAAKLSHPHLLRLFETGSCQLDNIVLLYVVMEYAEENLALILPQRALTPDEARDLLEPALDALAYVHGKSLVHGSIKPSNIMAAQDQLKLSSDTLLRVDDPTSGAPKTNVVYPSVYDAPEISNGTISPASDSWSLGMTLMEALTQRLPAREGMAEPVLETVPAPFMGIAHCCLRREPQRRCAAADIAARLRSNSASPISKVIARAQGPSTVRIPAESAKWRYLLPLAALVLIALAVLVGPKLFNRSSESQTPASTTTSQSADSSSAPLTQQSSRTSARQAEPAASENTPAVTQPKPSARKASNSNQSPIAAAHPAESAPSGVRPAETPATISGEGPAVQQVMPVVSKSARETIHGTIKVRVKVSVDASGNVQNASFLSPGPSKYFARQAMEAAQQWKFAPAQGQDPRSWVVRFGFKRSGTDAGVEAAP